MAHLNYAEQIPSAIKKYIKPELRNHLTEELLNNPIGGDSIMYTHNTFPAMAQKYHKPMWKVPSHTPKEPLDVNTLAGSRAKYEETEAAYQMFATELLDRLNLL